MTQLDDFEFESSAPASTEPPRPTPTRWWIYAIAAAGVIAALFFAWRSIQRPAGEMQTGSVATEEPVTSPGSLGAAADRVPLPPLGESDPFVRKLVQTISSHPQLAAWLVTNNLIDRFVASIDNIADGKRPIAHLRALGPTTPFQVAGHAPDTVVDPRSYGRYNRIADVAASIDAHGAAQLYTILKPLIDEAYRQLGYPDRRFDDTLARAIQRLLDTPMPSDQVKVAAREANYLYVDSDLEARTPIEKQLMRMGPRNVRLIQSKLREIARELGLR